MSVRRHREAPLRERRARQLHACGAASTSCDDDGVAHRARHRRDGVERRRQRHGAVDRHQARRALEADQALQRGRNADRAAGVGAERRPRGAGGDRGGAARGRAARHARRRVELERRRVGEHGKCGLRPTPEKANSDMWVRPISAAPALRRRATAGASSRGRRGARAGSSSRRPCVSPATSNRSLIDTARPASGPGSRPAATARSAAAAAARAAVERRREKGRGGARCLGGGDRALDRRRWRRCCQSGSAGALR